MLVADRSAWFSCVQLLLSPSHPIPSHPIPPHLIPSHPIPSHPVPSHPVPLLISSVRPSIHPWVHLSVCVTGCRRVSSVECGVSLGSVDRERERERAMLMRGVSSTMVVAVLVSYALLSTSINLYMISQQRPIAITTCTTHAQETPPFMDNFPLAHQVAKGSIAAPAVEAQRTSVTSGYGPMQIPDWVLQQDIYKPKSDIYFGDEAVNGSVSYREHYEVCIYQCDNRLHKMGRSNPRDLSYLARINNYMYARNWGYKYLYCTEPHPPAPRAVYWSKVYFNLYFPSAKLCDYIIFLDSDAFFSHHDMSLQTFFATYAPTFPHDKHFIIAAADGDYSRGPNSGVFIIKNTLRVPQPAHNYTRRTILDDHTRKTYWTKDVADPSNPGKTMAKHFPETTITPPTHHTHPGGVSNMTWEFIDDWWYLPARVEHYVWTYAIGHFDQVDLGALYEHVYYDHCIKLPGSVLHKNGQYVQHMAKEGWNSALEVLTHGAVMRTQARQSMALLYGQCTVEDYFQYHRLHRICHPNARHAPHYQPLHAPAYVQAQQRLLSAFTPDYVPTEPLP